MEQLSPVALGTTGAVVGLGLATKAAVDANIAWESSLAGIAKTLDTTGLSTSEAAAAVEQIGDEIRQLATEIPITATELAGVAEAAGQLGVAREDVVTFTETMAKLGVATDLTAEEAATAIARITNITGLSRQEVDRFGAALVDLGNNSAATESEILGMATRIAAAGNIAGMSEGEILGIAAALTSVGVNAEAGGTAVTQTMTEITKSVETADDRLGTFAEVAGLSAEQFAAMWRGSPAEALALFIEGLADLESTGGSSVLVLDELGLSGVRQSQALRSAAGAGDLMRESLERGNEAFEENNALNKEAEQRFKTTASQVQILKNNLNETALELGEMGLPAFNESVSTTTDVFRDLNETIDDTKFVAGELTAALGPFGEALEKAAGNTDHLRRGFEEAVKIAFPAVGVYTAVSDAVGVGAEAFGKSGDEAEEAAPKIAEYQTQAGLLADNMVDLATQVDGATEEIAEQSDTVTTWLELQAEAQQRALGVARGVGDQTAAYAENDLALSGLVGTTGKAADATVDLAREQAEATREAGRAASAVNRLDVAHNDLANTLNPVSAALDVFRQKIEDGIPLTDEQKFQVVLLAEAEAALKGQLDQVTVAQGLAAAGFNTELSPSVGNATGVMLGGVQAGGALFGTLAGLTTAPWIVDVIIRQSVMAVGDTAGGNDTPGGALPRVEGPTGAAIDAIIAGATPDIDAIIADILEPVGGSSVSGGGSGGGGGGAAAAAAEEVGVSLANQIIDGLVESVMSGERTVEDAVAFILDNLGELGIEEADFFTGLADAYRELEEQIALGELVGDDVSAAVEAFGILEDTIREVAGNSAADIAAWVEAIENAGQQTAGAARAVRESFDEAAIAAVEGLAGSDPLGFLTGLQSEIDALQTQIDLAPVLGIPQDIVDGWIEQRDGLQSQVEQFALAFGEAFTSGMLDPSIFEDLDAASLEWLMRILGPFVDPAILEDIAGIAGDTIFQVTQAGLDQLQALLTEYPELAGSVMEDIVAAVSAGALSMEEAMMLLADVPDATLRPALERLRDSLLTQLAEALLSLGPDSPEVQALLASLDLINGALSQVGETADKTTSKVKSFAPVGFSAVTNATKNSGLLGQSGPGGSSGGFSGGGSSLGGGGGSGGASLPNQAPSEVMISNPLFPNSDVMTRTIYDTMTGRTRRVIGYAGG